MISPGLVEIHKSYRSRQACVSGIVLNKMGVKGTTMKLSSQHTSPNIVQWIQGEFSPIPTSCISAASKVEAVLIPNGMSQSLSFIGSQFSSVQENKVNGAHCLPGRLELPGF